MRVMQNILPIWRVICALKVRRSFKGFLKKEQSSLSLEYQILREHVKQNKTKIQEYIPQHIIKYIWNSKRIKMSISLVFACNYPDELSLGNTSFFSIAKSNCFHLKVNKSFYQKLLSLSHWVSFLKLKR